MATTKTFTIDEVAKHNNQNDVYVIIHGRVYDVTQFNAEHPGGPEILMEVAGADGTEGFEDIGHSDDAKKIMKDLLVGEVEGAVQQPQKTETEEPAKASTSMGNLLDPKTFMLGLGNVAVVLVSIFFALVLIGLFSDPDIK